MGRDWGVGVLPAPGDRRRDWPIYVPIIARSCVVARVTRVDYSAKGQHCQRQGASGDYPYSRIQGGEAPYLNRKERKDREETRF